MDADVHERRELEPSWTQALKRNEFLFHYQPVIAAADGTISGLEALIRWNHPTRGLVPPTEFIPVAERPASSTGSGNGRSSRPAAPWPNCPSA